jgi:hypothetical protein
MRFPSAQLPTSAEADRRLADSRALAARAQAHIEQAKRNQHENNLAAIVQAALGLGNGGNHAKG